MSFSPASFRSFGNQFVNTTSAPQTMSITNTGSAGLSISSFTITPGFGQSNTCGSSLAINASCSVSVTFTPAAQGNVTGTLMLNGNLPGSAPSFSLSGTGTAPALSFSPIGFNTFGTQRVNTTSAPQTMTISNTGNASLTITSFTVSAGFNQTNNCGSFLASGVNCAVNVTFSPTAQGPVNGTLTLNSNLAGNPPSFTLNGTGGASAVALSVNSLSFASQLVGTTASSQSVTLTNSGNVSLNISSISTGGDFAQTNNCPGSLAAGANCTISVTFTPTASGTRTGTLSIADDAPLAGSPQTVALSGIGYTLSASLNPSSLTFASQLIGTTSSPQNVTLTNTGSGTLSITSFTTSGNFAQTNNCPAALSAGGTCTVSVVFVPAVRGTLTGTLTLNSNATGTPPSVSLSGKGIGPVASLSPMSLTFGVQRVSTTSSSQQLTLTNSGDATMNITSIVASGDFAQTNNCNGALPAGQHCNVNVTFTPTASGARSGTLTISDNAVNGSPQNTALSGTGVDFSLGVSPASVVATHGSSVSITVTVSALGGNYNSSVNLQCSGSLPKGVNCNFSPGGVNPGSSSANSTLRINTGWGNGRTPPGSYAITISGTSGSAQHTTTVTLQVN
ncbi:MAG TPA: choice-of-anchor D domain-containing protein [Candidatus Binatus sp.]|nr:choice-of-anchor D domain-containing protein [Candidatus Binatus sp.]